MSQEMKMSRAEAGRKGGLTTKRRYGDEFFGKIGKIGGEKGGDNPKSRYGGGVYQKNGRNGGSREPRAPPVGRMGTVGYTPPPDTLLRRRPQHPRRLGSRSRA